MLSRLLFALKGNEFRNLLRWAFCLDHESFQHSEIAGRHQQKFPENALYLQHPEETAAHIVQGLEMEKTPLQLFLNRFSHYCRAHLKTVTRIIPQNTLRAKRPQKGLEVDLELLPALFQPGKKIGCKVCHDHQSHIVIFRYILLQGTSINTQDLPC